MPARLAGLALLAALALASPSDAGSIVGTIRAVSPKLEGAAPQEGGAYQSRRYKFLEKLDYSDLRDFVVSIDDVKHPPGPNQARPFAIVAQKDGAFQQRVLPIVVGTEVEWPNMDDIFHNVFSMSDAQPFDLGMYKRTEQAKSLVFEREGQVDVFCAIHSAMHCVVLVLPNPWFSLSGADGSFAIHDIPPGTYTLKAWHERLPAKRLQIVVPESGSVEINIEMGFADLPKI